MKLQEKEFLSENTFIDNKALSCCLFKLDDTYIYVRLYNYWEREPNE